MADQNLFPNTDGTQVTGITVTKSEGGGTPSNIVDGNTATTDVLSASGQYWQLDLGAVKNFCKYRIYPTSSSVWRVFASSTGAFAGEEYFLDELSTAGAAALQRALTINAWNTFYVNPKVSARYVRLVLQAATNETVAEFEVYEDAITAFGSLSSNDTDFDGAINSTEEFRRRSLLDNRTALNPPGSTIALNGGKYFQVDLGSQINVSQISTYVHATSTYAIKVSTTGAFGGEEVTVVADTLRTTAQYNDTANLPYTCRYVRIIVSGANTAYISEITIYEPVPPVQKTITSDASILAASTKTILSDTDIKKTIPSNILSDTYVVSTPSYDIFSDSDIFGTVVRTAYSNADIFGTIVQDILSDTKIVSTITRVILSDADIFNTISKDIPSDTDIFGTVSENILSDATIVAVQSWSISSDADIFGTVLKNIFSDSVISIKQTINIGSDTIIFVPIDLNCEVEFTKNSVRDLNVEVEVIQPIPSIPTGLIAVNTGTGDSIRLEWSGTSLFYNVYRVDPGPVYVKVNNFLISDNFYVVGGLVEGTTYTFIVRGADGQG